MKTIFLLDNYDSFTYNLYDYIMSSGVVNCIVKRNDEVTIDMIKAYSPDAIVLSPGPKRPKDAGVLMEVVKYFHTRLPILGVCLGHQAIGEFFGMKLEYAPVPVHGKTADLHHDSRKIFNGLENPTQIMRYHSLILEGESELLNVTSYVDKELVMSVEHVEYPIVGIQFHPESIGTLEGKKMIKNWLQTVNKAN